MGGLLWLLLLGCLGLYVTPSFQQIPLEMFELLGNMTNTREVLQHMVVTGDSHGNPIITEEGALDNAQVIDIIAGSVVSPDTCAPKVTSVSIPKDDDLNVLFFPGCVAMPQCGGCGCGHDMLECAAVEMRVSQVKVMRMRYPYPGASQFDYEGLVDMDVVEHTACACRCKVQAHNCHPTKHFYEEHSCRCSCYNSDDAHSCPSHQIWSNDECACVCPRKHWCLEDEFFSNSSCRCEMRSSFVKIVDIQGGASGECAEMLCRPGYRAVKIGNVCDCRISQVAGVEAGSLGGGGQLVLPDEFPSAPNRQPAQPAPTSAPARPTRPRRPRPGGPIRQTGSMIPRR